MCWSRTKRSARVTYYNTEYSTEPHKNASDAGLWSTHTTTQTNHTEIHRHWMHSVIHKRPGSTFACNTLINEKTSSASISATPCNWSFLTQVSLHKLYSNIMKNIFQRCLIHYSCLLNVDCVERIRQGKSKKKKKSLTVSTKKQIE